MAQTITPRSNRAKIFMAFDALSGLREALSAKERAHQRARQIAEGKQNARGYDTRTEEQDYDLDHQLANLHPGDTVTLTCSQYGERRTIRGKLKKIDYAWHQLVLDCGIVDAEAIINILINIDTKACHLDSFVI